MIPFLCPIWLYPFKTVSPKDSDHLGCVCFFRLMLNRTFFELNAEYYLIVLSIKLFVF